MTKRCDHKFARHFRRWAHVGANGVVIAGPAPASATRRVRLWTCSTCGREDEWSPSWSYFGQTYCPKCRREEIIEAVVCGDDCKRRAAV